MQLQFIVGFFQSRKIFVLNFHETWIIKNVLFKINSKLKLYGFAQDICDRKRAEALSKIAKNLSGFCAVPSILNQVLMDLNIAGSAFRSDRLYSLNKVWQCFESFFVRYNVNWKYLRYFYQHQLISKKLKKSLVLSSLSRLFKNQQFNKPIFMFKWLAWCRKKWEI